MEALKLFCDIIRKESFSKAALANHVTQSAVSQMVGQLEKRLGVQLIDRSVRPLRLTDAGKVYYEGCRRLVELYTDLEASVRKSEGQLPRTVQVAAIYSVGLSDMGQYVERFMACGPNAQVQIEYLHPDRVYEKVLDRTADFGLVSFPRRSRELRTVPWREEEMVLACSPRHQLARNLLVKPEQLAGERYIGFDRHLVIRREVDRFLKDQGITVDVAMEFDNVENIKRAVTEAQGIALLPEPTLRREVQAGTLAAVPLYGCRFVRPLGIVQSRRHKLSATATRFMNLLRQPIEPEAGSQTNGAPHVEFEPPPPAPNETRRGRNGATRPSRKRAKEST
jgi:DNA-binding transcriptional LysR family regulator